jgi:hypothetical protein
MRSDFSWERTVDEYLKAYSLAGKNQGVFASLPAEFAA